MNPDVYHDVTQDYEILSDNDPLTAYSIMKRASGVKEYFDSNKASWNKQMLDAEKQAKGVVASVQVEHRDLGLGVKEAEMRADCDKRVTDAWQYYSKLREIRDKVQAQADYLERIYFDCKMTVELARKKI